jgi:hypothetical protein
MFMNRLLPLFVLIFPVSFVAHGQSIVFKSGPQHAALIELYTSEGCSSCPPAERWFSSLRGESNLWKTFVPISFHVNYWDDLGWPDKLASSAFTQRQRTYASAWNTSTIYTPEFVLNGREWRDSGRLPNPETDGAKPLVVHVNGSSVRVEFSAGEWEAHVALLGSGFVSKIGGGENSGRTLQHDFVVLNLQSAAMHSSEKGSVAEFKIPANRAAPSRQIAAWITAPDRLEAVQATGGDLPK